MDSGDQISQACIVKFHLLSHLAGVCGFNLNLFIKSIKLNGGAVECLSCIHDIPGSPCTPKKRLTNGAGGGSVPQSAL